MSSAQLSRESIHPVHPIQKAEIARSSPRGQYTITIDFFTTALFHYAAVRSSEVSPAFKAYLLLFAPFQLDGFATVLTKRGSMTAAPESFPKHSAVEMMAVNGLHHLPYIFATLSPRESDPWNLALHFGRFAAEQVISLQHAVPSGVIYGRQLASYQRLSRRRGRICFDFHTPHGRQPPPR